MENNQTTVYVSKFKLLLRCGKTGDISFFPKGAEITSERWESLSCGIRPLFIEKSQCLV